MWLAERIGALGPFELSRDGASSRCSPSALRDGFDALHVYDVSEAPARHGWIVPAYPMPPAMEDIHVLRVVVRNGFSRDMAGMLLDDIEHAVARLNRTGGITEPAKDRTSFHH